MAKNNALEEFYDILWTWHKEIWTTYTKIKEIYWWKELFKDIKDFVGFCIDFQVQSKIKYRNRLQPIYLPSIHFQWVIDLIAMPFGLWSMKYLVVVKKETSNFIEGKILRTKSIEEVYQYILKDIFS